MSYELKKNIEMEIAMLREISNYFYRASTATEKEKANLLAAIESLRASMKRINNSIPDVLQGITVAKELPNSVGKTPQRKVEAVSTKRGGETMQVFLSSKEKKNFLEDINVAEEFVKRMKKTKHGEKQEQEEFKAARGYLKFANRFFLERAKTISEKELFRTLSVEIRRANIDMLLESYIAMMFMTIGISFIVSIVAMIFFFFFSIGLDFPFITFFQGDILNRIVQIFWIPIAIPILTFAVLYYYPSTEKKSIEKKINQELPFAVIHMSAISGSGIEPSQIFKIIASNREYPTLRKEFRKVLNQINLYGYDLVTALNTAAKSSPSEKLSELFSGFSISITSGASLQTFLEKRSETLLLNYRLERENYTRIVETMLDIYISVVIAAPMIFLLLFIMMIVSGLQVGFTPPQISLLTVLAIAILNVGFIMVVQAKQPTY